MALSVEQKKNLVKSYGFELLARDEAVKPGFPGVLMVKDPHCVGEDAWAVVGDSGEDLLDEAITSHDMSYYMFGEWEHIFNKDSGASDCRILLDTVEQTVVHALFEKDGAWLPVSRDGLADLKESMNDNDVWSDRDMQEGLERSNEKPDWA